MSIEFELEVMTHAHRDAIASLVASCKDTARYQHRAEKAEATLARVRAIVADPGAALVADRVRAALEAPK